MKPNAESPPGEMLLDALAQIVARAPQPQAPSEEARRAAELIGCHLVFLISAASDANMAGRHSVCLALFRHMEDALDCLAAVTMVPGAAEKYLRDDLKPSEAAKLWEGLLGDVTLPTGEVTTTYRKDLRHFFNHFAHCAPCLTDWNLYPDIDPSSVWGADGESKGESVEAELRVNHEQRLLWQNARRIDWFLTAHTLELTDVVEMAYASFLAQNPRLRKDLQRLSANLHKTFRESVGPVYLEHPPPEIKNPMIPHPSSPDLWMSFNPPSDVDDGEISQPRTEEPQHTKHVSGKGTPQRT